MTLLKTINPAAIRQAIFALEEIGYRFTIEGSKIHYIHHGDKPDFNLVKHCLAVIQIDREAALDVLLKRIKPINLAGKLIEASNKAAKSAQLAEKNGNLELAREEWKRFARLYAAGVEALGIEPSDGVHWKDWARNYDPGF